MSVLPKRHAGWQVCHRMIEGCSHSKRDGKSEHLIDTQAIGRIYSSDGRATRKPSARIQVYPRGMPYWPNS